MTKTVKYYSSEDAGAPQLLQTGWGHMVNLYRTVCDGYNEKLVESIIYNASTKLVKINFTESGHGFRRYQTIKITANATQYDNQELFVINAADKFIECQSKSIFTEVLITGTLKVRVAPLGLIHAYNDGFNKSAFRFPNEDHEDPTYLVINDTEPTKFAWNKNSMVAVPSVYMCKNLSTIDGEGENIVPFSAAYPNAYRDSEWKDTTNRNSWNYGIMSLVYQGNWAGSNFTVNNSAVSNAVVKWILIGNEDYHYLYIYPNTSGYYSITSFLYSFGKYISRVEGDQFNYIFNATYNYIQARASASYSAYNFYQIYSSYNAEWLQFAALGANNIFTTFKMSSNKNTRPPLSGSAVNDYAQTEIIGLKGITVNTDVDLFMRTRKYSASSYSGNSGEAWPPYDGKIKISRIDIYENTTTIERGTMRGVYWIHHSQPFLDKSVVKVTDENNRSFYAICMKNAVATSGLSFPIGGPTNLEPAYYSYVLISLDEKDWNE